MIWWQWIVLGVVLLGAEMMIDAQFYLVFLGVSAVTVGGVDLLWAGSPLWAEWLLFSVVSIASLILFRSRLHATLRVGAADSTRGLIGEIGTVTADIDAGGTGRIELRGTTWTARNVGEGVIRESSRARVEGVSGVTVDVRAAE